MRIGSPLSDISSTLISEGNVSVPCIATDAFNGDSQRVGRSMLNEENNDCKVDRGVNI